MHINEHNSIIMPCRLIRNLYYSVSLKTNETQADMVLFELDLQLPMQSMPITTDVVSADLEQGVVYNIM
jgi:hypothetical protein